jgi:hypothetical protein
MKIHTLPDNKRPAPFPMSLAISMVMKNRRGEAIFMNQ